MSRRTRTVLWIVGVLVVLIVGVFAVLIGPRLGATRTLITFTWPVPDDLESFEKLPPGYEYLNDPTTYGVEHVFVRRIQDGKDHPTLVFVHGVTEHGLKDGRILRAIEAFHRGGFTVVAPQLDPLMDPTRKPEELDGLVTLLKAIEADKIVGASPRRFGMVGISVGGAVALRAAATYQQGGGDALRAILAIGAPDDLRTSANLWFEREDPDPEGGESFEWKRRNAAAFARNFVIRAALPTRVGDHADREPLETWLTTGPLPKDEPPALTNEAAQELVRVLQASPAERVAARDALLKDAWPRLQALSPADWSASLPELRGVAIFLLHGNADPLVPVSELPLLEKRLAAFTIVSTFESHLLGHTTVGEAGWGDRFDHIVWLDDFFDMVGG